MNDFSQNWDFQTFIFICVMAIFIGAYASAILKRRFFAWAFYSFLIWPMATVHLIVLSLKEPEENLRAKIGVLILVFTAACATFFVYFSLKQSVTSFTPQDILDIKTSIKEEYEKENVTVKEVNLVQESPTKLTGYASIKMNGIDIYKECEATKSIDSGDFNWLCK